MKILATSLCHVPVFIEISKQIILIYFTVSYLHHYSFFIPNVMALLSFDPQKAHHCVIWRLELSRVKIHQRVCHARKSQKRI